MSLPNYTEVAYFLKTFGLKGELRALLLDHVGLDFSDIEVVFLIEKGQYIPYFIENCSVKDREMIIKLEDINSPEQARRFNKHKIYVDNKSISSKIDLNANPNVLQGFEAHTAGKLIGTIDRLESYPQQVMAFILTSGGEEVMIPLNVEFIEDIDEENSEIYFDLPDGLLDL